jgi:hypothetical protein
MSMARTAVEVDGLSAHGTREALDRDLARQNLLIRHGYLVLRYTRTHLRRPAKVAAEIIEVCQRRIDELARLASWRSRAIRRCDGLIDRRRTSGRDSGEREADDLL